MPDHWNERLSEYLDGELGEGERAEADAHLAGCAECRTLLDELRAVKRAADRLEDRPPAVDLWAGIEARIAESADGPDSSRGTAAHGRFGRHGTTGLAAAALLVLSLAAGGVWTALSTDAATPTATTRPGRDGGADGERVRFAAASPGQAETGYNAAISDLEHMLRDHYDTLDPSTVRVLEKNLRIIDRAIRDAFAALEQDPSDPYLNHHLERIRGRKLEMLREAVMIARAES